MFAASLEILTDELLHFRQRGPVIPTPVGKACTGKVCSYTAHSLIGIHSACFRVIAKTIHEHLFHLPDFNVVIFFKISLNNSFAFFKSTVCIILDQGTCIMFLAVDGGQKNLMQCKLTRGGQNKHFITKYIVFSLFSHPYILISLFAMNDIFIFIQLFSYIIYQGSIIANFRSHTL